VRHAILFRSIGALLQARSVNSKLLERHRRKREGEDRGDDVY